MSPKSLALTSLALSIFAFSFSTPALSAPSPAIQKAISQNPLRDKADLARDAHRKPASILDFWGIKPNAKVADLGAGSGFYTKILSAYLNKGHVTAVNSDFLVKNKRFAKHIKKINDLAAHQTNVNHISGPFDALELPQNLDGALFVNFYHDTVWLGYNRLKMNEAIFKSLKSGGRYLLIDHQAPWGTGVSTGKTLHRIEGETLIHEVLQAGFHLVKTSKLLHRSDDILTQSAVKPTERRGKTSRFVYLFQKP